jgi:N-methylhydantoinase B
VTVRDISAQVAACSVAERGLQDLAARYTPARLVGLVDALIERTERLVRREIATGRTAGVFRRSSRLDGIDVREVPVSVRITIEDEVTADFSNAQSMVRGALNCTRSVVEAAVYQCVRSALSVGAEHRGRLPPDQRRHRPRTLMDVEMPGPSSMRGVTAFRVVDAINGRWRSSCRTASPPPGRAAIRSRSSVATRRRAGRSCTTSSSVGPGAPTRPGMGMTASNPASSAANIPVGSRRPSSVVVDRYGFVSDSGGAGTLPRRAALERAWRCRAPTASLVVRSDRQIHPPYGLWGGLAGSTSRNVVVRNGEGEQRLPPMTAITMAADESSITAPPRGGWGDPLERDLESIADDVLNEKVSPEAAALLYEAVVTEQASPTRRRPSV